MPISQSVQQNSGSPPKAGLVFTECVTIMAIQLEFHNNVNQQQFGGGGVSFLRSGAVYIGHSEFLNNTSHFDGVGILCLGVQGFQLENIEFLENKALYGNGVVAMYYSKIFRAIKLTLKDNQVKYYGGGMFLYNCQDSVINGCDMVGNSAQDGGGMMGNQLNGAQIIQSNFIDNIAIDKAGGFMLFYSQQIQFENVVFNRNKGMMGGTMNTLQVVDSTYINVQFLNNYAIVAGGGIFDQVGSNMYVKDSLFQNNTNSRSIVGGHYINNCRNYTFENVTYRGNKAYGFGGAVVIDSTDVALWKNCIFDGNIAVKNLGGAVTFLKSQNVSFEGCRYLNNKAFYGGALSIRSEVSPCFIKYCEFLNNSALHSGGAIDLEVSQVVIIGSLFKYNVAEKQGGVIAGQRVSRVDIQDSKFQENFASQGSTVYLFRSHNLTVSFIEVFGNLAEDNGQIYLEQQQLFWALNSQFYDNQGENQGAVLHGVNSGKFKLENCTFRNNFVKKDQDDKSSIGGAVYIKDVQEFYLNEINFYGNWAGQAGGAIYLESVHQFTSRYCKFQDNYVSIKRNLMREEKLFGYQITQGGAIYFSQEKMFESQKSSQVTLENITFYNNSASSGSSLFIRQFAETDLEIQKLVNVSVERDYSDTGVIRYLGDYQKLDSMAIFQGVKITNDSMVQVTDNYIEVGFVENERITDQKRYDYTLCAKGTYLLQGGQSSCEKCSDNAICEGGYGLSYPKKHYWRQDNKSDNFLHCSNWPERCKGNDTCQVGYKGVLCEQCDYENDYSMNMFQECSECPGNGFIILSLVVIFFCYIFMISFTATNVSNKIRGNIMKQTLQKTWKKAIYFENNSSSIIKIGIMHFQIIYLLKPQNIQFPRFMLSFTSFMSNPGQSMSFPSLCMYKLHQVIRDQSVIFEVTTISYLANILMFLVLILFVLGSHMSKNCRNILKVSRSKLINIMIIFFITQQTGLIEQNIKFLVCRKIGDSRYSIADINLGCEDDFYRDTVYPSNLLLILILLIFIPGVLFLKLFRNRKNNRQLSLLLSYGYLYDDLKTNVYFWELVSMLQKIGVALISQLYFDDFLIKNFIAFTFIFVYYNLCRSLNPYRIKKINNFNQLSSLALMAIIISGIMQQYLTDDSAKIDKLIINILTILLGLGLNLYFAFTALKLYFSDFKVRFKAKLLVYKHLLPQFITKKLENQKINAKQARPQEYWNLVRKHLQVFTQLRQKKSLRKINPIILFENAQNEEVLYHLQNGYYSQVNQQIFSQFENQHFAYSPLKLIRTQIYCTLQTQVQNQQQQQTEKFLKNNSTIIVKKSPQNSKLFRQKLRNSGSQLINNNNSVNNAQKSKTIVPYSLKSFFTNSIRFKKNTYDNHNNLNQEQEDYYNQYNNHDALASCHSQSNQGSHRQLLNPEIPQQQQKYIRQNYKRQTSVENSSSYNNNMPQILLANSHESLLQSQQQQCKQSSFKMNNSSENGHNLTIINEKEKESQNLDTTSRQQSKKNLKAPQFLRKYFVDEEEEEELKLQQKLGQESKDQEHDKEDIILRADSMEVSKNIEDSEELCENISKVSYQVKNSFNFSKPMANHSFSAQNSFLQQQPQQSGSSMNILQRFKSEDFQQEQQQEFFDGQSNSNSFYRNNMSFYNSNIPSNNMILDLEKQQQQDQ